MFYVNFRWRSIHEIVLKFMLQREQSSDKQMYYNLLIDFCTRRNFVNIY